MIHNILKVILSIKINFKDCVILSIKAAETNEAARAEEWGVHRVWSVWERR